MEVINQIILSKADKQLILLCKGHYKKVYPYTGSWCKTLIPLFDEIYGWSAEEYYNDYLECIFNKLLNIWMMIKDDQSGNENQLRSIFTASFSKSISRTEELPIERAIAALCGLIQNTSYLNEDKIPRYNLEIE